MLFCCCLLQMMAETGKEWPLEPFDIEKDAHTLKHAWDEWLDTFELVLESKNILTQREKYVLLMTRGGKEIRQIFKNQAPCEEEELEIRPPRLVIPEYDNAIIRLNKYFGSKINARMELDRFRAMKQTPDEDFNKFLLRLRAQANRCDFSTRTDDEVLHQVMQGARDVKVRNKRIDGKITLDGVVQYAVGREMLLAFEKEAKGGVEAWQPQSQPIMAMDEKSSPGRKMKNSRWTRGEGRRDGRGDREGRRDGKGERDVRDQRNECENCGSWYHRTGDGRCPAKGMRCYECQRMGHLAVKCPTKKKGRKRQINAVEEDDWEVDMPKSEATNEKVTKDI